MGTATSGDSELIRVTLIDYFTEAILIDKLVYPDVPMSHLNTKYSGVTWADMNKAQRAGTLLQGRAAARREIWKYVGPGTVVVGHGVSNDLRSLRWIHVFVADSFVTEFDRVKLKEAEEKAAAEKEAKEKQAEEASKGMDAQATASTTDEVMAIRMQPNTALDMGTAPVAELKKVEVKPVRKPGNLALKTLAKKYLDRDIQTKGKQGHDSLEDAIAARDIVHWNVLDLMARYYI